MSESHGSQYTRFTKVTQEKNYLFIRPKKSIPNR